MTKKLSQSKKEWARGTKFWMNDWNNEDVNSKKLGGISQLGSFKSTGEVEAGSEMLPYNWLTLVSMPFQRQWIKGFLVCFWYPYIPICRLNGDIQSNWHPGNRFFKNTYRNFASIKKSTMSINWITKASE